MAEASRNKFVNVHIKDITPDYALPVSLYLFINGKFLEFKKAEDTISPDRYNQFIFKKMNTMFVRLEDLVKFDEWVHQVNHREEEYYLLKAGQSSKELIKLKINIRKLAVDLFSIDFDEKKFKLLVGQSRNFIKGVNSKVVADVSLVKLTNLSKDIVDHSINVATFSVFLAHHLGFTHVKILENLYLGALFHDYGKTLMDPSVFEKGNKDGLMVHPTLGADYLAKNVSMGTEVLRIIREHHEHYDGTGYPNGLSKSNIYELAKIVAIANHFDNAVREASGSKEEKLDNAILHLQENAGTVLDPEKVKKCLKAIRFG